MSSNLTVGKPGIHYLEQVIKVSITSKKKTKEKTHVQDVLRKTQPHFHAIAGRVHNLR